MLVHVSQRCPGIREVWAVARGREREREIYIYIYYIQRYRERYKEKDRERERESERERERQMPMWHFGMFLCVVSRCVGFGAYRSASSVAPSIPTRNTVP